MERLLPILAIIALVLGAFAAILAGGPFVLAGIGVFGLVVTVFVFLTRQLVPILLGAIGALLLIVAILGGIGGVTIQDTGADASIGLSLATACLVAGLALAAGGLLAARWDGFDPEWVGYVGAGSLVIAAGLAFVFMDSLGSLGVWAFVVGLLLLVAVWPTVLLLRDEPAQRPVDHTAGTASDD